jgi:hypothetical protein
MVGLGSLAAFAVVAAAGVGKDIVEVIESNLSIAAGRSVAVTSIVVLVVYSVEVRVDVWMTVQ